MNVYRFIEILERADAKETVYASGGIGQRLSDANKKALLRRYPSNEWRKGFKEADGRTFAFDCCGLVKAILWGWTGSGASFGGTVYESNGVPDVNEDGLINRCLKVSQDITTVEPGELLWMKGHCGVYVGNGIVIESTPAEEGGVQKISLSFRAWIKHGRLPWVYYWTKMTVKEFQVNAIRDGFKFPKYGADGEYGPETASVMEKAICKKRLINRYKNLNKCIQAALGIPVDGIFGKQTKEAVITFQKEYGLEPDGEVGPLTWKKLING